VVTARPSGVQSTVVSWNEGCAWTANFTGREHVEVGVDGVVVNVIN
jgi:hypothetical protein